MTGSESKISFKKESGEKAPSVAERTFESRVVEERTETKADIQVPTTFPSKYRQHRKDSVKTYNATGKLLTDRFLDLQKKYTEIVVKF